MKKFNKELIILIILLGAITRMIPHPPNFTPILAISLFAGFKFKEGWYSFLIPILAMLVSDLIIGLHYGILVIYPMLILTAMIGRNSKNILYGGVLSSLMFFIVSNFQVWISSGMYEKNIFGLLECYTMAIPFLAMTLVSTLVYSYALFSSFYLLTKTPLHKRV